MRLSALAVSAALATAACSNGPSDSDIADAQTKFAACATDVLKADALQLSDVKTELTNLAAEQKPAHADFSVSASLPNSQTEIEWKGKKINAEVSASMSFKAKAGAQTIGVSGYENALANGGANKMFSEELKPDAGEKYGVNVTVIYPKLQNCADTARAGLFPKQG